MNTLMRWAITHRGLESYFSSLMGSYVTVFTLHRAEPEDKSFNGISESLLERCLRYAVENGYDFMSVDEVVDTALQRKKRAEERRGGKEWRRREGIGNDK